MCRVPSAEKGEEICRIAEKHGWRVIVGVEPDSFEDIYDLRKLMRAEAKPEKEKPRLPPQINGNDYCPCRSGKQFKKCCDAVAAASGA